jgi:uncharacterized protein Yka (UPF0111/DUF47 family)
MFGILPRKPRFFELFEESATLVKKASAALAELLERHAPASERAEEIRALERRSEEVTREALTLLGGTFATPLDREDIEGLLLRLREVLALVEAAAEEFRLFKLDAATVESRELALCLREAGEHLASATALLRSKTPVGILDFTGEIRKLSKDAVHLSRQGRATLYESRRDAGHLAKWSDIYRDLEAAVGRCADAADVLETIVRKHS